MLALGVSRNISRRLARYKACTLMIYSRRQANACHRYKSLRIFDMLLTQLDICFAFDMLANASEDLYHIEFEREREYIEFATRQIYRAELSEAYRQIEVRGNSEEAIVKKLIERSSLWL